MAEVREFRLPDLGEGLTEAEIVAWLVAVGDRVALNQPLVEVQTAKADVELPSPFAGEVTALHAAVGDVVAVGAPLVSVANAEEASPPPVPAPSAGDEPSGSVLVGYGTGTAVRSRRRRARSRTRVTSPASSTSAGGARWTSSAAAPARPSWC